jgi:hypothetical protein
VLNRVSRGVVEQRCSGLSRWRVILGYSAMLLCGVGPTIMIYISVDKTFGSIVLGAVLKLRYCYRTSYSSLLLLRLLIELRDRSVTTISYCRASGSFVSIVNDSFAGRCE